MGARVRVDIAATREPSILVRPVAESIAARKERREPRHVVRRNAYALRRGDLFGGPIAKDELRQTFMRQSNRALLAVGIATPRLSCRG